MNAWGASWGSSWASSWGGSSSPAVRAGGSSKRRKRPPYWWEVKPEEPVEMAPVPEPIAFLPPDAQPLDYVPRRPFSDRQRKLRAVVLALWDD